jgi:3'-5' exoribonuclease
MNKLWVKDLEIEMGITGEIYLLAESSLRETTKGKPYLRATLSDRTGRIEARYWDVPTKLADQLEAGSGVRIEGVVEEWPVGSGERQVRIERLQQVEIQDYSDYLPRAKRDLEEMRAELQEVCGDVENPHLSQLLDHLFSDQEFNARFSSAPAAKLYHHACVGGLLEHTLAVVELCSFVADQRPEIDRDLLLTAAILHDVGKMRAYTSWPVLHFTDEGRLIDHVVEGALVVQNAIQSITGFPHDLRNRLLHAILAHHGALDRGSPVIPMTLEALALHHADWLDGSIRGFIDAVERGPVSDDGWTKRARMFGTKLYVGSQKPPEEEEEIPF